MRLYPTDEARIKKTDATIGLLSFLFGLGFLVSVLILPIFLFFPYTPRASPHQSAAAFLLWSTVWIAVFIWITGYVFKRTGRARPVYRYNARLLLALIVLGIIPPYINQFLFPVNMAASKVTLVITWLYYLISGAAMFTNANYFLKSKPRPLLQRVRPWSWIVGGSCLILMLVSLIGMFLIKWFDASLATGALMDVFFVIAFVSGIVIGLTLLVNLVEIVYGAFNFNE